MAGFMWRKAVNTAAMLRDKISFLFCVITSIFSFVVFCNLS